MCIYVDVFLAPTGALEEGLCVCVYVCVIMLKHTQEVSYMEFWKASESKRELKTELNRELKRGSQVSRQADKQAST